MHPIPIPFSKVTSVPLQYSNVVPPKSKSKQGQDTTQTLVLRSLHHLPVPVRVLGRRFLQRLLLDPLHLIIQLHAPFRFHLHHVSRHPCHPQNLPPSSPFPFIHIQSIHTFNKCNSSFPSAVGVLNSNFPSFDLSPFAPPNLNDFVTAALRSKRWVPSARRMKRALRGESLVMFSFMFPTPRSCQALERLT